MNTLKEISEWVDVVMQTKPSNDTIEILKSFIKFSPEKAADKIGVEREVLVKMFNDYKRVIHNRIIIFEKSQRLKSIDPNNFGFYYDSNYVRTTKCICIDYFELKYKGKMLKFYPEVTYLYYETDENVILFPMDDTIRKVYIRPVEFFKHFSNLRDFKISKLISNSSINAI